VEALTTRGLSESMELISKESLVAAVVESRVAGTGIIERVITKC
jgi:hypothetical protein